MPTRADRARRLMRSYQRARSGMIGDEPPRSWKYSRFQIGVAPKERLDSYTQVPAVVLKLNQ